MEMENDSYDELWDPEEVISERITSESLFKMIQEQQFEKVQQLLERDPHLSIQHTDQDGNTILHLLAKQ